MSPYAALGEHSACGLHVHEGNVCRVCEVVHARNAEVLAATTPYYVLIAEQAKREQEDAA